MSARPDSQTYREVARNFATFLNETGAELRPLAIYQNGNVGLPGISDLDFIIVVEDDFANGLELFLRIHAFVDAVECKDILFAHLPYLFPKTLAENIARYSFNRPDGFVNLSGHLDFSSADVGLQHILQQQEFLAERITIFGSWLSSKNHRLEQLMLFGHALVHSQAVIGRFRAIDRTPAKGIDLVEEARRRIASGSEPHHTETPEEVLQLLIGDAHTLLAIASEIIGSHLHLYMGESIERLAYSDRVVWQNFSATPRPLNLSWVDREIVIEGLPQTIPIVRKLLFAPAMSAHVIADRELMDAIEFRQEVVAHFARFNFLNFGNALGRGILSCYATGRIYDSLARHLIAALRSKS